MKFDFSKSSPDLQNKFQYIYTRLDRLLALARYNNELLRELVSKKHTDEDLQKTVDDFYETSPQTDTEEQIADN